MSIKCAATSRLSTPTVAERGHSVRTARGLRPPVTSRVLVPEGHARIAQRFNVGARRQPGTSPEGTAEIEWRLSRPFGTRRLGALAPNVETLGYSRRSLRDKDRPTPAARALPSNPGNIGRSSPQQGALGEITGERAEDRCLSGLAADKNVRAPVATCAWEAASRST